MDYNQFMNFLNGTNSLNRESVSQLQEYINEFPYFQSAHILLAKAMHEQEHVRFEKQLNVAAAYAGDRKILFEQIHEDEKTAARISAKTVKQQIEEPVTPIEENVFLASDSFSTEDRSVIPPPEENEISIHEETQQYHFSEAHIFEDEENEEPEETPSSDPHDIIRKRLNEILGLKNEPLPEVNEEEHLKVTESPSLEEEIQVTNVDAKEETAIAEDPAGSEATQEIDFIDRTVHAGILEADILKSLETLPVIVDEKEHPKEKAEAQSQKQVHTFYDWLKVKTIEGFGIVEEVHADDPVALSENPVHEEAITEIQEPRQGVVPRKAEVINIIDSFIRNDPRIVPVKSEFYSPASQAKKSVTEDENLVSETLARIYFQQGNLIKARSSYERLSLLYPEKMAYFAALISEVDQAINNLDKQDL